MIMKEKEILKANEPNRVQRFFLAHKEINVTEFARMLGINSTLMHNYISGYKNPSKKREDEIIAHLHKLGKQLLKA